VLHTIEYDFIAYSSSSWLLSHKVVGSVISLTTIRSMHVIIVLFSHLIYTHLRKHNNA